MKYELNISIEPMGDGMLNKSYTIVSNHEPLGIASGKCFVPLKDDYTLNDLLEIVHAMCNLDDA